jgi:tetratricopeptide (TPR) repeat protein
MAGESEGEGNLESAQKNYERAILLDPGDHAAYNNLAAVCQLLRKYPCAVDNFNKALKLEPNNAITFYNIGSIYDDAQDYKEARRFYQKSIRASQGEFIASINNVARLDILEGNPQKAIKEIQPALEKAENAQTKASLLKNLGWAYFQMEQYKQAQVNLEKSIKIEPDEASSHCLLAKTKNQMNLSAKAQWELCLFLNSELPEVWDWKQEFVERLEKKL